MGVVFEQVGLRREMVKHVNMKSNHYNHYNHYKIMVNVMVRNGGEMVRHKKWLVVFIGKNALFKPFVISAYCTECHDEYHLSIMT